MSKGLFWIECAHLGGVGGSALDCRGSLRKYERLAVAGRYAGAVMYEVNNPLEAIGNLVFLTKTEAENASKVREHMQVVESQLARLGEITRKSLAFYREEAEPKEFDLVVIAEKANSSPFAGTTRRSGDDHQTVPTSGFNPRTRRGNTPSAVESLPERAGCSA